MAAGLIGLVVLGAPARAQGPAAAAVPGSFAAGFATPVVAAQRGGELSFVNADLADHNFVALEAFGSDAKPWCDPNRKGRCPLFWSNLIGTAESTPVLGLDQTKSGVTYSFYCTIHPNMKGTLAVL